MVRVSGHGGVAALAAARRYGVSTLFTLSGGHIFPLYDAAVRGGQPVRLIDVRHEQTAVFAAEATARLTRTPGLAAVTAGPGVTNSVSAVTTAWLNGVPVVVLAGRAPDYRWGAGSLQEIDHPPLLAPVTKRAWTEHATAQLAGSVDEAFRLAAAPHRGPVFLDVSLEALYDQAAPPAWPSTLTSAASSRRATSPTVVSPRSWSFRAVTRPTPHSRSTGSGCRNSSSPSTGTTSRPSGLATPLATLARNVVRAMPTVIGSPTCSRTCARTVTLLVLLGAIPGNLAGQITTDSEYQSKATYLLQFPHFVEWPEAAFSSSTACISLTGSVRSSPPRSKLRGGPPRTARAKIAFSQLFRTRQAAWLRTIMHSLRRRPPSARARGSRSPNSMPTYKAGFPRRCV